MKKMEAFFVICIFFLYSGEDIFFEIETNITKTISSKTEIKESRKPKQTSQT